MKRKEFMKNAVIMTVTALLLRGIGIVFRIFLSNRIGAEGMGLYQLIFSVYVLGSTFASTGISTAVARLITDELVCGTARSVKRILRRSVMLSVIIGLISAVILFLAATPISEWFLKDVRAIPSLKILGISLPFMGVTSCIRGYFMARRKSACTSIAQITEQISRMVFITLLLNLLAGRGLAYTCLAVILGDSLAEMVSCLYMTGGYLLDQRHIRHITPTTACNTPRHGVLYRITEIALPITAGRYLNSALRTVENILVPNKLTAFNGSTEQSLSEFGMLKGMAMPLLFFPSSFLSSLSTLLIPELSEAHTLHQQQKVKRAVVRVLQLTLLISMLLSGLFTVFAYDLGETLYHSETVGFLLRVLAPLMPVMYLESIVDGMLKGLGQQVSSLIYSVLDSASRIALILFILPAKGLAGFLFIMVLSNLLTSLLNLHRLLKVTGVQMQWSDWVIKPVVAVSLACAITELLQRVTAFGDLTALPRMVIGSLLITVLYAGLSLLLGTLNISDLQSLRLRDNPGELSIPEHF